MIKVIGVKFRGGCKVYYFDPDGVEFKKGESVVVETSRGTEMGCVVLPEKMISDDEAFGPIKKIIRKATEEDTERVAANKLRERDAVKQCQEKAAARELEMKVVGAEYTFDNSKLIFYFTADGRVDFRELVKDLASVFHTRIELRQIGVRDETKMLGGIGVCGRELCCCSYLNDFAPVSIKMAKEQNLSLNPTKISGVCGRLMCCLANEQETYEYLNSQLPVNGDTVTTPDGKKGVVANVSVLRQMVRVIIEEGDSKEAKEYPAAELRFRPRKRKVVLSENEEALEELSDEPKPEAPKNHHPKNDHPRNDRPRAEKTRYDGAKQDSQKSDAPKSDETKPENNREAGENPEGQREFKKHHNNHNRHHNKRRGPRPEGNGGNNTAQQSE